MLLAFGITVRLFPSFFNWNKKKRQLLCSKRQHLCKSIHYQQLLEYSSALCCAFGTVSLIFPPDSARVKIYSKVFHAFLNYCRYLTCKTITHRVWERERKEEPTHTHSKVMHWQLHLFTLYFYKQPTLSNKACLITIAIRSSWLCIPNGSWHGPLSLQFDNYCNKILLNEFFSFKNQNSCK